MKLSGFSGIHSIIRRLESRQTQQNLSETIEMALSVLLIIEMKESKSGQSKQATLSNDNQYLKLTFVGNSVHNANSLQGQFIAISERNESIKQIK